MTRANLNFHYQNWGDVPKTLYFYHNGDQYPSGLRDYFNIKEWLVNKNALESAYFVKWITQNYKKNPKDRPQVEKITHPCIMYDSGGFMADYSYLFDATANRITVYKWDKKIFKGSKEQFITWLDTLKKDA